MTRRLIAPLTAGITSAVAAIALTACGGGSHYRFGLDLPNAGGLRTGSLVQVGGVPVGKVSALNLLANNHVHATLELDHGPVGRDAHAAIASRNLLGEKYVDLTLGNRRDPLPAGTVLPAGRVRQSVDLDQILDVLGPTTRARIAILIDEAGAGLTGQGTNLNAFLHALPPTLDKATTLLDQVVTDNHTLGDVIDRSDRFIATLARQRRALSRLIDTTGRASQSFATQRTALIQTLQRAPGTLTQLRNALAEVQATAPPLGKAARAITASAPALTHTLDQVEPFRRAAAPTLTELRAASPAIAQLGHQATPVVRHAEPTLAALRGFGASLAPVTRTLGVMVDDLMAAIQGWSRAIQARDGLSHMFRAKVVINPESLNSIITRLTRPTTAKTHKPSATKPTLPALIQGLTQRKPAPAATKPRPVLPSVTTDNQIGDAINGVLDYLLGK